ncbi:vWA domain-containing protein [Melittangium boletus]|uniref:vWA domain-containing protein n=1 Tax=Melittangium boletus TaxID=83453 RepID=UPI003DA4666B
MNRTHVLLAAAALLALGAAVAGLPAPHDPFFPKAPPAPQAAPAPGPASPRFQRQEGALRFEGQLSSAVLATGTGREAYALLTVRAERPAQERRVPVSLALVIDRSGSMRGQKISDARRAARLLVGRLGPRDRLALVHYGTDVVTFPSEFVTEEARARMLAFVAGIEDEDRTNLSGGLEEGARALRPHLADFRANRLILLSDGVPNVGTTHPGALAELAAAYRREGIAVSGLGVGEDFNEQLMRALAEQGGGFYGYLQDSERLAEILQREVDQAATTLASGVELRLTLPEGITDAQPLGVASRREAGEWVVPLYDLAGEQEAQVLVKLTLALDASSTNRPMLHARLRYQDVEHERPVDLALSLEARAEPGAPDGRDRMDPEVALAVTRALGAQQLQAAAEAMKQGERTRALGLLDGARTLFGASASALAGEVAEVERTQAAYLNAHDETSVKREALKLHNTSLRSFGQSNSY